MGKLLRLYATTTRPADANDYILSDEVSNSAVAAEVVRPTFDLTGFSSGRVLALGIDVTPASGNLETALLNLEVVVFKQADAPAPVGDNTSQPLAGETRRKAVGHFRFDNGGWKNPAGAFAADASGYQQSPATRAVPLATPTIADVMPNGYVFDFRQGEPQVLELVVKAGSAWAPGAVENVIGFCIYLEVE